MTTWRDFVMGRRVYYCAVCEAGQAISDWLDKGEATQTIYAVVGCPKCLKPYEPSE